MLFVSQRKKELRGRERERKGKNRRRINVKMKRNVKIEMDTASQMQTRFLNCSGHVRLDEARFV